MSQNDDWTKTDDDPEDFVLPGYAPSVKDADDIEKENSFRDIPEGEHVLQVLKVEINDPQPYRVEIDGKRAVYTANSVKVWFCLPDDKSARISDFFVIPPFDPKEAQYYQDGKAVDADGTVKKNAREGFHSEKFGHFISRLGWPWPKGGDMPKEAQRVGNWYGRTIKATVKKGRPYTGRDGQERQGFNQIQMFSYRPTEETVMGVRPAAGGGGAGGGGEGNAPRAAQQSGRRQVVPTGVDDL